MMIKDQITLRMPSTPKLLEELRDVGTIIDQFKENAYDYPIFEGLIKLVIVYQIAVDV